MDIAVVRLTRVSSDASRRGDFCRGWRFDILQKDVLIGFIGYITIVNGGYKPTYSIGYLFHYGLWYI